MLLSLWSGVEKWGHKLSIYKCLAFFLILLQFGSLSYIEARSWSSIWRWESYVSCFEFLKQSISLMNDKERHFKPILYCLAVGQVFHHLLKILMAVIECFSPVQEVAKKHPPYAVCSSLPSPILFLSLTLVTAKSILRFSARSWKGSY